MLKKIFFVLVVVLVYSGVALAQDAKDVYKTFRKIEGYTQSGINYRDYNALIGEAQGEVNIFLSSNESKDAEIAEKIKLIMTIYSSAKTWWNLIFQNRGETSHLASWNKDIDDAVNAFFRLHPEANKEMSDGGVLYIERQEYKGQQYEYKKLYIDRMLSITWDDASKHIDMLNDLLNKPKFKKNKVKKKT